MLPGEKILTPIQLISSILVSADSTLPGDGDTAGEQDGVDFMIHSGILSSLAGDPGVQVGEPDGVQVGLPDGAMVVLDLVWASDTRTDLDGVTEDFTLHGATTIATIIMTT